MKKASATVGKGNWYISLNVVIRWSSKDLDNIILDKLVWLFVVNVTILVFWKTKEEKEQWPRVTLGWSVLSIPVFWLLTSTFIKMQVPWRHISYNEY